jgi:predicted MPP superfamily phosphohydrolase
VIAIALFSFLLLFLNLGRRFDTLPLPIAQAAYEIGTSSIMVMLYLVLIFLALDLGRLLHIVPRELLYGNLHSAVAIALLVFGTFIYGNLHYNNKVRVPMQLTTKKPLPHDYRIVMLSDLHLGYHNPRRELARWVDMVNAEKPDLILIAGDIIDGSMRPLIEESMADEFHRFSAPVYACLGNHEYYAGEPRAQQFYRDAGIHLLRDSVAQVGDLLVIGRDDRTNPHRKPLAKILSGGGSALLPSLGGAGGGVSLLLDHQPYHLEQAERQGIDFQFSGHTHHGQVWPISWITDAIYECSFGSHQRGATRYYVSSGMGIWGGKFRIGTRSEYVVLHIVNHQDNNK